MAILRIFLIIIYTLSDLGDLSVLCKSVNVIYRPRGPYLKKVVLIPRAQFLPIRTDLHVGRLIFLIFNLLRFKVF